MNVIFHKNCLDGAFSSYIAYLTSKLITEEELNSFINYITQALAKGIRDLTNYTQENMMDTCKIEKQTEIAEQFFHTPRGVYFNAFSFFAGEYYPLSFPGKARLLLILDTNLVSLQNIQNICSNHQVVLMIDHHTSFKDIKDEILKKQIKNFAFVFDQKYSAALLTYNLLSIFFNLQKRLSESYTANLNLQLRFVCANDTKINESRQSKQFVLGFYYFEIDLSHNNPNLYKRIGLLDLQYVLQRGKNLYQNHLTEIKEQIRYAKIAQFLLKNNRFKSKKFMYLQPHNANKISDIGNVLAYLSSKNSLENLCILAMKKQSQIRISCRSHRYCKDPSALELARLFEGGGHTEAAGFKINQNKFRNSFKIHSLNTFGINIALEEEDIQQILLANSQ